VDSGPYLDRILDDESLAGDLDEADAAALVKGIITRAEATIAGLQTEADADAAVQKFRVLGRGIGRTVAAWRNDGPPAADVLAKKHGLPTIPAKAESTADVLNFLLDHLVK